MDVAGSIGIGIGIAYEKFAVAYCYAIAGCEFALACEFAPVSKILALAGNYACVFETQAKLGVKIGCRLIFGRNHPIVLGVVAYRYALAHLIGLFGKYESPTASKFN